MMAVVGLGWEETKKLTLAQLTRMSQSRKVDNWNYTAEIVRSVEWLHISVQHLMSSSTPQYPNISHFHPYMKTRDIEPKKNGVLMTIQNERDSRSFQRFVVNGGFGKPYNGDVDGKTFR